MSSSRIISLMTLFLVLALSVGACSQSASPTPAPVTTPSVKEPGTAPTKPAQPSEAAPKAASSPTSASPAPTKPAASAPAINNVSVSDITSKAKSTTEYSFTSKITANGQALTAAGQALTAKTYVKGTKMRQEMSVANQNTVMIIDASKKVAYTLLPGQKGAMKMDFSQAVAKAENPSEKISSLPADAKSSGTETIDGKSAAVYELPSSQGATKMWIWADKGLPLKMETSTAEGKVVIEFTDYQFGSQPDSLFELPAGTEVMDLQFNIPGAPGNVPVPGK